MDDSERTSSMFSHDGLQEGFSAFLNPPGEGAPGEPDFIRVTEQAVPPEETEDPVPEWKEIQKLFRDELKQLRKSLPAKSWHFSKIRIEPVKYSEDREVILLRTSIEERDGTFSGGAAILDLETGEWFYINPFLFLSKALEPPLKSGAHNLLDLNRAGWLLLIGDHEKLYLYDIADRTEKILPEDGPFSFAAFPEDDRYVLCQKQNTVYVFSAESGELCARREFSDEIHRIYLTGGNTFALEYGSVSCLCRIEPDIPEKGSI